MLPLLETFTIWCQKWKETCLDFLSHGHDLVTGHRKHWAAGIMSGLAIFFATVEVPRILYSGVLLGFIISAVKYVLQNLPVIIQHVIPTTFTFLGVTLFLFHGLTSITPVFTWLPVFVSATLLATVNVSPGVAEKLIGLGEGLFALSELRGAIGTPWDQAIALEEGRGLLPRMSELQTPSYWGLISARSIRSSLHRPQEARDLGSPEGTDESIELDDGSLSTSSEIRLTMQPLDADPEYVPQYNAIARIGLMDEQRVYFPEAPQDNPPEMDRTIEEPSLRIMVPG